MQQHESIHGSNRPPPLTHGMQCHARTYLPQAVTPVRISSCVARRSLGFTRLEQEKQTWQVMLGCQMNIDTAKFGTLMRSFGGGGGGSAGGGGGGSSA